MDFVHEGEHASSDGLTRTVKRAVLPVYLDLYMRLEPLSDQR